MMRRWTFERCCSTVFAEHRSGRRVVLPAAPEPESAYPAPGEAEDLAACLNGLPEEELADWLRRYYDEAGAEKLLPLVDIFDGGADSVPSVYTLRGKVYGLTVFEGTQELSFPKNPYRAAMECLTVALELLNENAGSAQIECPAQMAVLAATTITRLQLEAQNKKESKSC